MKVAKTTDGKLITATAEAPEQAICPRCGGVLILRSRRTMDNGKITYYWRHHNNRNIQCSARGRRIG